MVCMVVERVGCKSVERRRRGWDVRCGRGCGFVRATSARRRDWSGGFEGRPRRRV